MSGSMRCAAAVLLAAAVAAAGCGTKGDNVTDLVPVKCKVVGPDGRPVPLVEVNLYPTQPGGIRAFGTADKDGVADMRCFVDRPGMAPGKYKATVAGGKPGAGKVAAKYAEEASTDLTAEVSSGTPEVTLPLK